MKNIVNVYDKDNKVFISVDSDNMKEVRRAIYKISDGYECGRIEGLDFLQFYKLTRPSLTGAEFDRVGRIFNEIVSKSDDSDLEKIF